MCLYFDKSDNLESSPISINYTKEKINLSIVNKSQDLVLVLPDHKISNWLFVKNT